MSCDGATNRSGIEGRVHPVGDRQVAGPRHAGKGDDERERQHQRGDAGRGPARRLDQAVGGERALDRTDALQQRPNRARQRQRQQRSEQQHGEDRERVADVEDRPRLSDARGSRWTGPRSVAAIAKRMRLSPADSTWYLPFCSAWTGSTRAACQAGISAATMLVATPMPSDKRRAARTGGDLVRPLGDAVHIAQQRADRTQRSPRAMSRPNSRPPSEPISPVTALSREEQHPNLPPRRAERPQDADFGAALRHRDRERVVDDEHPDEQREQAGDAHHHRIGARSSPRTAARGRTAGRPGSPARAARAAPPAPARRAARLHGEVDAIERPAAPEHLLRGVDVHDGEIAAERRRQAGRLHDAANRERPLAQDRAEGHRAAAARSRFARRTPASRSASRAAPGRRAGRR